MAKSFQSILESLNSSKVFLKKISDKQLRALCESSLNTRAVSILLKFHIETCHTELKVELVRRLVRNPNLSIESRIRALKFFFFEIGQFANSDSKKRILAQELLSLYPTSADVTFQINSMVQEIGLKREARNLQFTGESKKIKTGNVVSLESDFLKGVTLETRKVHLAEEPFKINELSKNITFVELEKLCEQSPRFKKQAITHLNQPWGVNIESLMTIIKDTSLDLFKQGIKDEYLVGFIQKYFGASLFLSRLSTKPFLSEENIKGSFQNWRHIYGRSFLLSNSQYVPDKFVETHELFKDFVSGINPRNLYLRRTYGIKSRTDKEWVSSLIYFVRTPSCHTFSSGRYVIVVFSHRKLDVDLMKFLGLVKFSNYIKKEGFGNVKLNQIVENCYVKECELDDEPENILALLHLEFPLQFLGYKANKLTKVEKYYSAEEETRREQFLSLLARKKVVINRIRERSSPIHCIICNQPLTDELSMKRGYGPDCWKKIKNLKVSKSDITATADVFERYTTTEFTEWVKSIYSVATELFEQD